VQGREQAEATGLHGDAVGFLGVDLVRAPGRGAGDRADRGHHRHTGDPPHHAGRRVGQWGRLSGQGFAGRDGEHVGAELVDLLEQTCPAHAADAEDEHERGHADRDAERRQRRPQRASAQTGKADRRDVAYPQPGGGRQRDGGLLGLGNGHIRAST
jgi:hypothetical protein